MLLYITSISSRMLLVSSWSLIAMFLTITFILVGVLVGQISGHGMMLEPPNRSSVWRYDSSATPNYNDNGIFCGGKSVQWDQNGGKCGVCGDAYNAPHPQPNENTGTYGKGKVVRTYKSGGVVDVHLEFERHHMGAFDFSLCILQNPNAPEPGESCFQPLKLANGADKYQFPDHEENDVVIDTKVQLPAGVTCDRCTFRWNYRAGNGWGPCDDGTQGPGCGPQESFRNCADIAIN